MELSIIQAAEASGLSVRRLQYATSTGDLPLQRMDGRSQLVDSVVLRAFTRENAEGRRWNRRSRQAALELLSYGVTRSLTGSELSRLRATMRNLDAAGLAHRLGVTFGWFRYRSTALPAATVLSRVRATGPSQLEDHRLARRLGLVAGPSEYKFGITRNLRALEGACHLVLDGDGDIFLTQRDNHVALGDVLVDLYLFGEERESNAAGAELVRLAARL